MKTLILCLAFIMASVTPSFAGYRLVIAASDSSRSGVTSIDFDYQDKDACEKAAIPAQSIGWITACIPTDTHTANLESD